MERIKTHGGLFVFDERDRHEYRSEPSDCPRWYRRVTKMYPNRHAMPSGTVARLGTELRPGNREYTACVKVETRKTYWRR